MRADTLERMRPAATLGEAVRVTQDSGPAKRASVLHWTSEKAAVVYAGSSEPSVVESSKVIRYLLKSANITSRIPAIVEHVGAPYAPLQVQHEAPCITCMGGMLLRRRRSESRDAVVFLLFINCSFVGVGASFFYACCISPVRAFHA